MRVVVATIVHHPLDARILRRQIGALRQAGHEVTYVAPWGATGTALPGPWTTDGSATTAKEIGRNGSLSGVDVPRSTGGHRLRPLLAARRRLRELVGRADVVVVHDPELLLALPGLTRAARHTGRPGPVLVWDVHEDTAAAVRMKPWLPAFARGPLAAAVRRAERIAERRIRLLLAEDGYRERFRRPHPVVPNLPTVPEAVLPAGEDRVVYVGMVTPQRGLEEMRALGRRLAPHGIRVEVIGEAGGSAARSTVRQAVADGDLVWHGRLPNDTALGMVDGALAGLSLLRDEPNYRHSRPTKIAEYLARGVPVVSTPLPLARSMLAESGGGVIVPFGDVEAAARAVLDLKQDAGRRADMARRGHAWAREHANWIPHADHFVTTLETWVKENRAGH
ncbi:MAG: hypothetical protein QG608_466 [Actinomycetota bacterium]|nr:hypothetical protein [Actinomycetota bacterium]